MPAVMLMDAPGLPLRRVVFPLQRPAGAELLVGMECCTLCRSDLHSYYGRRPVPLPGVLGHEIVGRILAFGAEASRRDLRGEVASVGDRITWCVAACCGSCFFCQHGLTQKCQQLRKYGHEALNEGDPYRGGLAEHIVLWPGTGWLKISPEVPVELAAMVNCSVATATAALRQVGRVHDTCLVILGAGVLGLMAAAQARKAGARQVIVSDPVAEHRQRALAFGATQVASAEELQELVKTHTGGRGADIVLELAGASSAVMQGMHLLRTGGTMVLAGTVSPTEPVPLEPEMVVRRMLTLRGLHNYQAGDLIEAVRFLEGSLSDYPWQTLMGARFPLEEATAALNWGQNHPGLRAVVLGTGEQEQEHD